jgi:hypothetical protein
LWNTAKMPARLREKRGDLHVMVDRDGDLHIANAGWYDQDVTLDTGDLAWLLEIAPRLREAMDR